ncbi:MAG: DMT family transporter [Myxococcota bacterium]
MTRPARTFVLTSVVLCAFAANSLLCRWALAEDRIDPASFAAVRLGAGALVLVALVRGRTAGTARRRSGGWAAALSLLVYAVAFSFAYVRIEAGLGALLLFGAVQTTMLSWSVATGERLSPGQWAGVALAIAGLCVLTLRGASIPQPGAAALMLAAGVAWGAYTLLGRRSPDPLVATEQNFARAAPGALAVMIAAWAAGAVHLSTAGVFIATVSGAVTSGLAYALWYEALRRLRASQAAVVQLLVPVIAAAGGALLLGERPTMTQAAAGAGVLVGVAAAVTRRKRKTRDSRT